VEKPFFTYLLRCADGSFYVGHTDQLEQRITEHQAGLGCEWTKTRLPIELAWSQEFPTRDEAKAIEAQLKGWSRAKKEALIDGRLDLLPALASRSRAGRALRVASK
jgi:predicted GIY-YIG superfamily endonuclease